MKARHIISDYIKILQIKFIIKQITAPITVGRRTETHVHLMLPLSFFIVSTVVEQGQWKSEKITVQSAVFTVQPFAIKMSRITVRLGSSVKVPPPR